MGGAVCSEPSSAVDHSSMDCRCWIQSESSRLAVCHEHAGVALLLCQPEQRPVPSQPHDARGGLGAAHGSAGFPAHGEPGNRLRNPWAGSVLQLDAGARLNGVLHKDPGSGMAYALVANSTPPVECCVQVISRKK